ncbi:unnamed protein product [Phytophthora lilii]|uniref:Unnamed protein product n=1 Tax=Phytophthora lilii TaxID=2077276 RepID=A0A9W6THC0_9STRA|nr:unnamed protein product [Phytophthora lilii]
MINSTLTGTSQLVAFLKDEIKAKAPATVTCDARVLQLYVAKKNGHRWLPDDDPAAFGLNERNIHPAVQELIGGYEMNPTRTIKSCLFVDGGMPWPGPQQIHVLVKVQPARIRLWLVTATVKQALRTMGVRHKVYLLLKTYFGYYDPNIRTDGCVRDVLQFENELLEEGMTASSALCYQPIATKVEEVSRQQTDFCRIYLLDYDPEASSSPQRLQHAVYQKWT